MQETAQSTSDTTEGEQTVAKVKKLPVMEIFGPTIQGEGFLAGAQTAFIRFGLCDYKCRMCDSVHAIDPQYVNANAMWMEPKAIYEEVIKHADFGQWVTLSGGNPAIHDLGALASWLQTTGRWVAIETQGTKAPSWIGTLNVITVSPKPPGMGERFEPSKFDNFLDRFRHHRGLSIKVVIFSAQDIEFAAMINEQYAIPYGLADRFFLSLGNPSVPQLVNGELYTGTDRADDHRLALLREYAILAEEICQDSRIRNARFMPQLHVLAWSNQPGR